ncbi:S8 family peptidase|uniref:Major intracellular serine protease n=1 Tax=Dendrosporobacter quercicolus TaxID=146817 RepID=A0A1G9RTF5_9FIRM|nr:S8 family peptidase [Dendrosporobacter quercicolus]NSL49352.1 S8 family peptidase [Dendrosporobacter quercicolus DSM 1736]SDM26516.1 major intracellular serine protease [Dendrosporobacter quercicolus]
MNEMNLMPFTVENIIDRTEQIPEGIQLMKAPEVWEEGKRGKGVVVAVLDTGCQIDHPDLQDRIIGGRNFTTDDNSDPENFTDYNGHGTHVAGTIAAVENGQGVVGMAPQVGLLILKVLDSSGSGGYENLISAIDYALAWQGPEGQKVRILSMSLGGPADNQELHDAIIRAIRSGVLVVCAAGNTGQVEKQFPGGYNEVVGVGAVDLEKKLAEFSTMNKEIDVVAPGVNIVSTYPDSRYAVLSGTSMATPHVAGAAALIINQCEKDFERTLTEAEIYAQLCKRTSALGYKKIKEGNGFLDLTVGYQIILNPLAAIDQCKQEVAAG